MQRPLLLGGFMATGKSTVGARVAQLAGVPFVDLDSEIERRAGKTANELFQQHGEAHFRELEHAELSRLLSDHSVRVVALGGGALLRREVRLDALQRAVVVSLEAPLATLLARAQDGKRPLLKGRSQADVEQLLQSRQVAYAEAHERIDVGALNPDQVAQAVLQIWQRNPVGVAAGLGSYSVEVGSGFAPRRAAEQVRTASNALIVTDQTVGALYGQSYLQALATQRVSAALFELQPGEEHKNPASLEQIWLKCLQSQADRKSWFIGLGGGVVTDMTGFAAATWMRGVSWLSVPTTLLGMVDASVGGKTAVDLPGAKNCVGAFWQPGRVLCDVDHLKTEPQRGLVSALAEVVKTALIGDPEMFELLEREAAGVAARDAALLAELVRRSVEVKARVVSEDERETGFRAALNLGHTVGHALEACGGFGALTHGEAVSLGLVAALRLGAQLGVTDAQLVTRTERLLSRLGLPVDLETRPLNEAAQLIGHDKKRGGATLRFVLCSAPGRVEFRNLPLEDLKQRVPSLAQPA